MAQIPDWLKDYDDAYTLLDCGCVAYAISRDDGSEEVDLAFCPLHEAAPDLLTACEIGLEELDKASARAGVRAQKLEILRSAIANAKGGK